MTDSKEPQKDSVGTLLTRAREEKGLTQTQLSRQLRLPSSIIRYIESDQIEQLAPIYRRGYIRNFARQVGLDEHAVLALIPTDADSLPELRDVLPTPRGGLGFERIIRGATYGFATLVIVLPLVWLFVEGGARFFEPGSEEGLEIVSAESSESTGKESSQVSQRLAYALSLDDPEQSGTEPSHLSASAVPLRARRSSQEIAPEEVSPSFFPVIQPTPVDSAEETVPLVVGQQRLVLELDEDSWVEIRDTNGVRLEYNLVSPGLHEYQGSAPFTILLGRGSTARVQLDDQPVDFGSHVDGDVARFELLAGGDIR